MVNRKDKRKSNSNCDNNVQQKNKSRPKRRKLEDSSIVVPLDTKKSNLEKLPANCMQLILSFMSYEDVFQMGQVCKTFNKVCKKLLDKGHQELEGQLKSEIELAETEKRLLFPTNMSYFLMGLREAIHTHTCAVTYVVDMTSFAAGKSLDDAYGWLKVFRTAKVDLDFQDNVSNQKQQRPTASKRVCQHYELNIEIKSMSEKKRAGKKCFEGTFTIGVTKLPCRTKKICKTSSIRSDSH